VDPETQSWSEAREADLLQRMHVGIMPLPQGAWEYGKSGYKLVQYMAASRPVVASPVGVNCDVVKEGVNGFFAITEEEWIGNLERFRGNLGLTQSFGAAARAMVEESFSLEQVRHFPILRGIPKSHEECESSVDWQTGDDHGTSL
jgi:glycosyltransferase involved in cell wall biosynthesis